MTMIGTLPWDGGLDGGLNLTDAGPLAWPLKAGVYSVIILGDAGGNSLIIPGDAGANLDAAQPAP